MSLPVAETSQGNTGSGKKGKSEYVGDVVNVSVQHVANDDIFCTTAGLGPRGSRPSSTFESSSLVHSNKDFAKP